MPNIAQVFKEEIARISRKQSRAEIATLKRAVARHRAEIAALKRLITEMNKRMAAAQRYRNTPTPPQAEATETSAARFSAKGLVSHRKRLGLSAAELGRMFGVSGQTIYLWESKSCAKPSARNCRRWASSAKSLRPVWPAPPRAISAIVAERGGASSWRSRSTCGVRGIARH